MSYSHQQLYTPYEKRQNGTMRNYLILHGHFYQPPREDPWTGIVHRQPSAAPFHDWNKRITKECYAANCASRLLDTNGLITDIVNNYEFLSFNFGPTLLQWLELEAPRVYERIRYADKTSIDKNNGHGNAIAQVYNHVILPLADREDAETQILWGLEDFERRFGRKSEGIWLAETAVSEGVIDLLIRHGTRFIILSPWQAEATSPEGSKAWIPLKGQPVPSDRAYRIDRSEGSIAVFFYDPDLAQGISFEHYLRNGEKLYEILLKKYNHKNPSHLITAATDGEIYGHHEPFGDMCLAYLTTLVERGGTFTFTNYGNYLDNYPPRERVKLKAGEDEKGSSWSCTHGVSRWYKDCGCSTGAEEGWDQKWRTPLREALDGLAKDVKQIYQREMSGLTGEGPFSIRNSYGRILSGRELRREFIQRHIKKEIAIEEVEKRFFQLLEGQKYMLYSFTSCAWFFADISGIETIQNLRYALKAIELYADFAGKDLLSPFLKVLERAESNSQVMGSGRSIMEKQVLPISKTSAYPAAFFIMNRLLDGDTGSDTFGYFSLIRISGKNSGEGEIPDFSGEITLEDTTLLKQDSFEFAVLKDDTLGLKVVLHNGSQEVVPIHTLPSIIRERSAFLFAKTLTEQCASRGKELFNQIKNLFEFSQQTGIQPPMVIRKAAELSVSCAAFRVLKEKGEFPAPNELKELDEVLFFAQSYDLDIQNGVLRQRISTTLSREAEAIGVEVEEERVNRICLLLSVARRGGIEPDLTILQNTIFSFIRSNSPKFEEELERGDIVALKKLRLLIRLGGQVGINTDEVKETLLSG
jgi:hypothetical protein